MFSGTFVPEPNKAAGRILLTRNVWKVRIWRLFTVLYISGCETNDPQLLGQLSESVFHGIHMFHTCFLYSSIVLMPSVRNYVNSHKNEIQDWFDEVSQNFWIYHCSFLCCLWWLVFDLGVGVAISVPDGLDRVRGLYVETSIRHPVAALSHGATLGVSKHSAGFKCENKGTVLCLVERSCCHLKVTMVSQLTSVQPRATSVPPSSAPCRFGPPPLYRCFSFEFPYFASVVFCVASLFAAHLMIECVFLFLAACSLPAPQSAFTPRLAWCLCFLTLYCLHAGSRYSANAARLAPVSHRPNKVKHCSRKIYS